MEESEIDTKRTTEEKFTFKHLLMLANLALEIAIACYVGNLLGSSAVGHLVFGVIGFIGVSLLEYCYIVWRIPELGEMAKVDPKEVLKKAEYLLPETTMGNLVLLLLIDFLAS